MSQGAEPRDTDPVPGCGRVIGIRRHDAVEADFLRRRVQQSSADERFHVDREIVRRRDGTPGGPRPLRIGVRLVQGTEVPFSAAGNCAGGTA